VKKYSLGILIIITILSLFLVSCKTTTTTTKPATTSAQPKSGGTLKIGDAQGPVSVGWPADRTFQNGAGCYPSVFFDTLIKADDKGNYLPNLATQWEVAPDKMSITLTMRKGVKFHDGSDWNAAVAKWNIDQLIAAKNSLYLTVTSVDIVDDYKIRLNMSTYANTMFTNLASTCVVSKDAFDKNGQQWMMTHAVGTGPFKFDSFTPDVSVRGVRFDDYWGGKPLLDAIELYVIKDAPTRAASFEKKEMDVANQDLSKTEYDLTQKGFVAIKRMISMYCLIPDSKNADSPFSKQKVREAVSYAIDRESICKSIGYGFWTPIYQYCLPGFSAYIPDLPARSYDPDKAKQLLSEAGYPNGFKSTFIVDNFVSDRDACAAIQGYLGKVGITLDQQLVDMATSATVATGGWRNGLFGAARALSPNINAALQQWTKDTAWWTSLDKTPEYYQLYMDSLTAKEYDPALAKKAVRNVFDNTTMIPVYTMVRGAIVQPYVHDTGFYTESNFWYWTPAKAWVSK
jgi:peptide/nickel transport system substrate-binding protein